MAEETFYEMSDSDSGSYYSGPPQLTPEGNASLFDSDEPPSLLDGFDQECPASSTLSSPTPSSSTTTENHDNPSILVEGANHDHDHDSKQSLVVKSSESNENDTHANLSDDDNDEVESDFDTTRSTKTSEGTPCVLSDDSRSVSVIDQEQECPAPSPQSSSTTTTDNCDNTSITLESTKPAKPKRKPSVPKSKNNQAHSSDDDDDEEDDPDFDPTRPANLPAENLSEEDSEGEVEAPENSTKSAARGRGRPPKVDAGFAVPRKRPATMSSEEAIGSLASKKWKAPKLVSISSWKPSSIPTGIPPTRTTFLSGKPSDIGLGGDLKRTGLSGVLAALRHQKQTKLTTLEKSRLDWQAFKQREGLEDELRNQLKSRNGYLEKRDFLERTDHRQFEIEKDLRAKHRRNPLGR